VALGTKAVSVTGTNEAFVKISVSRKAGGTGVDVRVQVSELTTHRINKTGFGLISKISSPVRMIYPNDRQGNSSYG
jgi:hypothetical protein